jgi:hypothetical protein
MMGVVATNLVLYGNLTPLIPLSLLRRGGGIKKRGFAPLKHPA